MYFSNIYYIAWQATVHRVTKSQTQLSDWAHIYLSVYLPKFILLHHGIFEQNCLIVLEWDTCF